MSLQFNMIAFLLVFLIVLGLMSQNSAITISAAVLLIMQQTLLSKYIPILEQYGIKIGIIILTIGVLAPLVSGKIQLPDLSSFLNWKMGVSILIGALVAWLAGKGVPLMGEQPVLVTGLLIGTIIGVSFLGGIPVGPLIAAGILAISRQLVLFVPAVLILPHFFGARGVWLAMPLVDGIVVVLSVIIMIKIFATDLVKK